MGGNTAKLTFVNYADSNLFLGVRNDRPHRGAVNCSFKGFRVSSKWLYADGFAPPTQFTTTADTLLLLDFSAGKGNFVPDVSGKGHHGTITGGLWSR
jgi:hypothetical protein